MPDGTQAPASQPQQPPFGSSPATQPTPNRGHEAAGLQKLGLVIQSLTDILPLVGASSDVGQFVLDMLKKGSKFVPAGSVTPASQRNQLEQMAMKQGQNNQQMMALKAMQQGGQQPGQQPPMPPQQKAA